MNRDQWRAVCEGELGKPYIWGAEGPAAYDCSGFAQFALRQLNLDPPGDQTAAGLFRFFSRGRSEEVAAEQADLGDLVFFGSKEDVTHIGLAWGNQDMIEAGGGGRTTTTVAIARRQKAEVRIKPIARRRDLIAILRPRDLVWTEASGGLEAMIESTKGYGRYEGSPPLAEWLEDGRHMRLKRPFGYVEEGGRDWPVPSETVVDGASIPRAFWSLIGGPLSGKYRDASIVHDYYCDVQSRSWRETHRVFHDAMRCSGVDALRAKVMFYAVYRFGPRWSMGPSAVAEGLEAAPAPEAVPMPLPIEAFDAASFEADAARIRADNLDIAAIEALADGRSGGSGALVEAPAALVAASMLQLTAEAEAAFARKSLLERLLLLQDTAGDPASSEAVGILLSRYSARMRSHTPTEELEAGLSLADLKASYEQLYAACTIRPERADLVGWHRTRLQQYRARYEAVSARTGVPWWFVGVVHALEASFNLNGHLHNGDPLASRTVQVPKKRPPIWNPPNDWESSAVDALEFKGFGNLDDWSLAACLFRWESYNGFGYYARNINSPYLWSFSNHYSKGKFVADYKYEPSAVSTQCGAAVMLKSLQEAGIVKPK